MLQNMGIFYIIRYMKKQKKIKLRNINKGDLSCFLKWWRDEELIKLTSGIYIESEKILQNLFNKMLAKNNEHFMIIYNKKIIGHISLTRKSRTIFEIHIVIGEKKYQSLGLGTIAIKKALDIGFNILGYKKAYLEVRPDNIRAIKAYEKCGFTRAGFSKYENNKNQPIFIKMILPAPNWN